METIRNKYVSCHNHCCTICPTFGSIADKGIIYYFVGLIIMWVLKIVECYFGGVGLKVFG